MCASTLWPLLSSTRNIAFGSASTTWPSISMTPSFLAMSSANCSAVLTPAHLLPAHTSLHDGTAAGAEGGGESSHRAGQSTPNGSSYGTWPHGRNRSVHILLRGVSHQRLPAFRAAAPSAGRARFLHRISQQPQLPGASQRVVPVVHPQLAVDVAQLCLDR